MQVNPDSLEASALDNNAPVPPVPCDRCNQETYQPTPHLVTFDYGEEGMCEVLLRVCPSCIADVVDGTLPAIPCEQCGRQCCTREDLSDWQFRCEECKCEECKPSGTYVDLWTVDKTGI